MMVLKFSHLISWIESEFSLNHMGACQARSVSFIYSSPRLVHCSVRWLYSSYSTLASRRAAVGVLHMNPSLAILFHHKEQILMAVLPSRKLSITLYLTSLKF